MRSESALRTVAGRIKSVWAMTLYDVLMLTKGPPIGIRIAKCSFACGSWLYRDLMWCIYISKMLNSLCWPCLGYHQVLLGKVPRGICSSVLWLSWKLISGVVIFLWHLSGSWFSPDSGRNLYVTYEFLPLLFWVCRIALNVALSADRFLVCVSCSQHPPVSFMLMQKGRKTALCD